jgi:hypothetical protein
VYEITHRRVEIIARLAVFIIAEQGPTTNLVVTVMFSRRVVNRQVNYESRYYSPKCRPVFTNPVRLDVKPAFLQHRTPIDKWTKCRHYGQVTKSAFFRTDPLKAAQPILNECFGLKSSVENTWPAARIRS